MKEALEIMFYGMGGIFTAVLIIMGITYLLRLVDGMES